MPDYFIGDRLFHNFTLILHLEVLISDIVLISITSYRFLLTPVGNPTHIQFVDNLIVTNSLQARWVKLEVTKMTDVRGYNDFINLTMTLNFCSAEQFRLLT